MQRVAPRAIGAAVVVAVATAVSVVTAPGCGSERGGFDADVLPVGRGSSSGGFGDADALPAGCIGLKCNLPKCEAGKTTTISGTAYAPNGTLPLYNVIAFVPNAPLQPFVDQLTCDQCGKVSGDPIASATSDAKGHFELKDVPAGENVPFVVQVGKWRRKVTIPRVDPCVENKLTNPELTRLPKMQSEGDLPHIAVTTGDCDSIACILPRMGVDASEFGVAADIAKRRIIVYKGAEEGDWHPFEGATPAQDLWGNLATLSKFDTAIFSCECEEYPASKPDPDRAVVTDYLNQGGRMFTTDYGYTWFHGSNRGGMTAPPSPFPQIMGGFRGGAPDGNAGSYTIDVTFPKGAALDEWIHSVDASNPPGKVDLTNVFRNFDRVSPTLAQRWVYGDAEDKVFSITTPFSKPKDDRCGKAVFLDMHVGDTSASVSHQPSIGAPFPKSCGTAPLTPQEKMMVFFLMDLASCIQDDAQVVAPPR